MRSHPRPFTLRRSRLAAFLLALIALVVATATGASAQVQENLDKPGQVEDTEQTPQPKSTDLWKQVGGALFPTSKTDGTELVDGSATRFDTDLVKVSFRNTDSGFAGGSECLSPPIRKQGEPAADYGRRAAACEDDGGHGHPRVPALYRYANGGGEGGWQRVDLPGGDRPGYVGAIAWMRDGRALAVGGDGVFPHREPKATET